MKGTHTLSLTPLAIFLTPLFFGGITWLPLFLSEPQSIAQDAFPLIAGVIPYACIFGMLLFVKKSRYVLFRTPLCWLTVVTCYLSFALWMIFWFGDDWLWMGPSVLGIVLIGLALFAGPLVFIVGLMRLRGRGEWMVPVGQCIHCGYNLSGLDKDTLCPECGKASEEDK